MPPLRVLVTGTPGVGKTTLVTEVSKRLPAASISGFLCHERRGAGGRGSREAFDLVSLDGARQGVLANMHGPETRHKVSKYFVQVEELEKLTFPILDAVLALKGDETHVLIFDEIGKMELFSSSFVDRVRKVLNSRNPNLHVLGTVALYGQGFIGHSKGIQGVEVVEIDERSRDADLTKVGDRFLALFGNGHAPTPAATPASVHAPGFLASSSSSKPPIDTTGVRVSFDQPKPGEFSQVYLSSPEANFASVNAGDYKLYVGGKAINEAFQRAFENCGCDPKHRYEILHKALLQSTGRKPGCLQWLTPGPGDETWAMEDIVAMCGMVPQGAGLADLLPVGLVSISVLPPGRRPCGSDKNVAMVYVVGPNAGNKRMKVRRDVDNLTKEQFLELIELIGVTIASSVKQYKIAAAASPAESSSPRVVRRIDPEDGQAKSFQELDEANRNAYKPAQIRQYWERNCKPAQRSDEKVALPSIETLRVCLFSGGVYKHPDATKVEVATAIIRGLLTAEGDGELPLLDFAYDEDCFRQAWAALSTASTNAEEASPAETAPQAAAASSSSQAAPLPAEKVASVETNEGVEDCSNVASGEGADTVMVAEDGQVAPEESADHVAAEEASTEKVAIRRWTPKSKTNKIGSK